MMFLTGQHVHFSDKGKAAWRLSMMQQYRLLQEFVVLWVSKDGQFVGVTKFGRGKYRTKAYPSEWFEARTK